MQIGLLLEMVAEGAPDRVVVGSRTGGIAAADLLRRSRAVAAWFAASGAERIGFVDVNSEALPIALFGAAIAGLPFAPVNYRLADDQLEAILRRLAPALVVVGPDVAARIGAIDGLQIATREELLAVAQRGGDDEADLPMIDPDDVAIMLFTSGTTGAPKAALLRHRHLTSYVIGTVEYLGADEDDAQLVSVPPYHIAGVSAILSSCYSGRRIVYLPGFDAEAWVDRVQERGHHASDGGTDDARPPLDVRRSRRAPAADAPASLLRRRPDATRGHRARHATAPERELRQRVRAHRDELDDLGAHARRSP